MRARLARRAQRRDLILHKRNQRRDDEANTLAQHRRYLIAEALAAAGRQHGQRVAPGQNFADHVFLQAAKFAMAENAAQNRARVVDIRLRQRKTSNRINYSAATTG